jgi:hypothetical protein
MQHMLNKFQGDLGNISSEIKHLQDKSMLMSVQLRNRKETEERLGTMIESISITQPLSTQICEAAVNEAYIEYLLVLNNKVRRLRRRRAAPRPLTLARRFWRCAIPTFGARAPRKTWCPWWRSFDSRPFRACGSSCSR